MFTIGALALDLDPQEHQALTSADAYKDAPTCPRRRLRSRSACWETAKTLVAAEFVHTSSRLTRDQERDGVPDPQLHSHVVILTAQRDDGRFAAVDSRELFRSQRANGAWYRAEFAHELRGLGLEVRGRTGRDGRFFELQGVPEELSRRWSRRSEVIERAAREFRDRYGRSPHAGELGAIAVATKGHEDDPSGG